MDNSRETVREKPSGDYPKRFKEWWIHCPGLQNPADLASRGAPALVNSQLWWSRPEWLSLEEEKWPDPPDPEKQDLLVQKDMESESRGVVANTVASIIVKKSTGAWNTSHHAIAF